MPNYKVVDADVLDADLQTVANAIKAKAGTEEALEFPSGFASAVESIETGGGDTTITAGIIYDEVDANGNPVKVSTKGEILPVNALYGYSKMTDVALPQGLKAIGASAFCMASSLTQLYIPESVETLSVGIAERCTALTSAHLPTSFVGKLPNGIFKGCTALTSVNIPDGVTEIGDNAFATCRKLSTTLPEGLRVIGIRAFENCDQMLYDGFVIPASVETISNYAILKSSSSSGEPKSSITFKGTPTSISSNALLITSGSVTINVPWAEGEVANAPWGAKNATINYNYVGE